MVDIENRKISVRKLKGKKCRFKRGESWNGKWELSERFMDKETSTTTGRRALSEVTRSADEGVARWNAVYQLSGGSGRFRFQKGRQDQVCEGLRDQTRLQSEEGEEWNEC